MLQHISVLFQTNNWCHVYLINSVKIQELPEFQIDIDLGSFLLDFSNGCASLDCSQRKFCRVTI